MKRNASGCASCLGGVGALVLVCAAGLWTVQNDPELFWFAMAMMFVVAGAAAFCRKV
jgi:hypothetical protein